MPIPVLGALAAGVGKKLVGKALRWATRGKLVGSGGGREALKRVGGAVLGTATVATTAAPVIRAVQSRVQRPRAGDPGAPYELDYTTGEYTRVGKRNRRMNYTNPRALNRAIRRLGGAEKIFRKIFSFNHGTAATKVRPKFRRRRA